MFWVGEALRVSMLILIVILIWFQVSAYITDLRTLNEKSRLQELIEYAEPIFIKFYSENYTYMKVYFPEVLKGYYLRAYCNGTLEIQAEYGNSRVEKHIEVLCNETGVGIVKPGENCIYKRNGLLILGECE